MPPDGKDDEEQIDLLLGVFNGQMGLETVKGKRPGTTVITGQISVNGKRTEEKGENGESRENGENGVEHVTWKLWDRECWLISETGEIFTDYEYVQLLLCHASRLTGEAPFLLDELFISRSFSNVKVYLP